MPELTDPQKEQFRSWINEHATPTSERCAFCGAKDWGRGSHFLHHPAQVVERMDGDFSKGIPLLYVACQRCGFLLLFHAAVIGLDPNERYEL